MQFIDLKEQYTKIEKNVQERIRSVLEHGAYIMGPEVQELESQLADFTGARHCITCSSGTDALLMPLMAWGISAGDAVFLPPFTFFATAEVVSFLGATPVFVDIDPVTFNMDPRLLARAIEAVKTQNTGIYPLPKAAADRPLVPRAVIPVDLFGIPAEYAPLLEIAHSHDMLVLEDAAQSFGAMRSGKRACSFGCHAAGTSFFPAKPLGCYGDGGAIFTDDADFAGLLQSIRVHGKGADKYDNCRIGLNGRLDTLQAAILLEKLAIFPDEIRKRQQVAGWYAKKLETISDVAVPFVPEECVSVFAQYCIRIKGQKRDSVVAALRAQGIPTNIYYPIPVHLQSVYSQSGYGSGDMPVAEAACAEVLALPFHPYMPEADVETVCLAVKGAL